MEWVVFGLAVATVTWTARPFITSLWDRIRAGKRLVREAEAFLKTNSRLDTEDY